MSHWWRAEDTSIDHPKLLRLSDAMHRAWYTLMCIASANGGVLPPTSDIALRLRMKPNKVAEWITVLVASGLFDDDGGTFRPHNWAKRQYKSDVTDPTAPERMKRYRERKRNERNSSVTLIRPDTEADTEQKTEKKETRASALVDDGWPNDYREQFWKLYPHKIGKPDALAKLERIRKRGVSWVSLMDGLRRYIASKPVDRPWCNPATWLNQARWEDQPAGSVVTTTIETGIDWDAVLTSFKRFGIWSKHAGPDLDSPECRAPADMLAKYGFARAPIAPPTIPHLRSMDS